MRFMRCMECNKKISEKASVCPNCGCDIDYTYQEYLKYRKGLNNKLIHIVVDVVRYIVALGCFVIVLFSPFNFFSVLLLISCFCIMPISYALFKRIISIKYFVQNIIGFGMVITTFVAGYIYYNNTYNKHKVDSYYTYASLFYNDVFSSGIYMEDIAQDVRDSWYDYIYNNKYDSPNDALAAALKKSSSNVSFVEIMEPSVTMHYEKLLIVPEKCKHCNEVKNSAKEVYYVYKNFYNLVIHTTGTYSSFTKKYSEYDSDLANQLKEFSVIIKTYNN